MIWDDDSSVQVMKLAASVLFIGASFSTPIPFHILRQKGRYLRYMQAVVHNSVIFSCWFILLGWSPSTTVENSIITILVGIVVWLVGYSIWFFVDLGSKE